MEENVARRCNRVMLSADLAERMQTVWPRRSEQAVPCVGTEAEDAGELTVEVTEADGTYKSSQITTQAANRHIVLQPVAYCRDEKDSGAG